MRRSGLSGVFLTLLESAAENKHFYLITLVDFTGFVERLPATLRHEYQGFASFEARHTQPM